MRQKSSHAELRKMMTTLLKTRAESEAQLKSGGQQRLSTADTAGSDAMSPSLDCHRWIAPMMAPGAGRRNVVVSLVVESEIGALGPQVSSHSGRSS